MKNDINNDRGGILWEDHLAKLPDDEQRAIAHESARLTAEILLMNEDDEAKEILNRLPEERRQMVVAEMTRQRTKHQAKLAKKKTIPTSTTSDSLATAPTTLLAKGK